MAKVKNKPDKNPLAVALGRNIRSLRKGAELTQSELAEILKIGTFYFGQVERGEKLLALSKIVDLCRYFKVDIGDLIPVEPDDGDPVGKAQLLQHIIERLHAYSFKQLAVIDSVMGAIEPFV